MLDVKKKNQKYFILILFIFFSISLSEVYAQHLNYLYIILRGDCYFTLHLPNKKIVGMNYEKRLGETTERIVYSGPYSDPQYMVAVEPDAGLYSIDLVGSGLCKLDLSLLKGETTVFNKTFTIEVEEGEFLQMVFNLRQFGQDYGIWESEIEDFHKSYLDVSPDVIDIGLNASRNQEIPITIKTPDRVPPTGVSGSVIPAENITFLITDLTSGEAPSFKISKESFSFSENIFSVAPGSSKTVKLKIKLPEDFVYASYDGYIYVKSSIGDDIIILRANPNNETVTKPPTTVSYGTETPTIVDWFYQLIQMIYEFFRKIIPF